jgi:HNH endonuclease
MINRPIRKQKHTCACGCGQTPKKKTSVYMKGHCHIGKTGDKATNWKGGEHLGSEDRWFVYVDGVQVLRYRHVMEQHLGRKLLPSEIVHHIDEDETNDDINNLEIKTSSKHQIDHMTGKHWTTSETHKKKCSDVAKKRTYSDATRKKMSESQTRRFKLNNPQKGVSTGPLSEITRCRMSESAKHRSSTKGISKK